MFVVLLTFVKSSAEIERAYDAHAAFLDRYHAAGTFLFSGKQNPKVGGVIICQAESRAEVEALIAADPFLQEGIAEFSIIEFTPTKCAPELSRFLTAVSS